MKRLGRASCFCRFFVEKSNAFFSSLSAEIAINDNEFTSGSLDPVCKYADSITADAGIFCQCDCLLCDATDTDCNPVEDIDKGFVDVTRETYTESEDIEFGPASVTP